MEAYEYIIVIKTCVEKIMFLMSKNWGFLSIASDSIRKGIALKGLLKIIIRRISVSILGLFE